MTGYMFAAIANITAKCAGRCRAVSQLRQMMRWFFRGADSLVRQTVDRERNARTRLSALRLVEASLRAGALALLLCLANSAVGQVTISNVTVVNVTPTSFSIVWSEASATLAPVTPAMAIFADSAGVTNLGGQVGLEYYPLNSGATNATNAYQQRLSQNSLRQESQSLGLAEVRISGLNPGTTYYFQVQASDTNGAQASLPLNGPFPAVTTAQENGFVIQSLQLVINIPPSNPAGSIILLTNALSPSVLAGVIGDGAASNQVYFSLSDILAASGSTNLVPVGDVVFTANVLGNTEGTAPQSYDIVFTTNFSVGQNNQFAVGGFLGLSLGSTAVQAGASGSLPLGVFGALGVTNLTFNLTLPTNSFSALTVQALSPQVGASTLQMVSSNLISVSIAAPSGQILQGAQTLAQLNFTVASNQPSAFVPVNAQTVQVANYDGSAPTNVAVQTGQLIIVGQQPLLQTSLGTNGARSLALYGIPWNSYVVQFATNLSPPIHWVDYVRIPMTNLVQMISDLSTQPATIFYRAYQLTANPPVMDIAGAPSGPFAVTAYGLAGTNYTLQYATDLSPTVVWHPLVNYTLTNSFRVLGNIGNTNPGMFFRILAP
jgi:hypothetical protein